MRVRFPAYRRYKTGVVAANDTMMALLIGARLGEHSLEHSAATATTRLPELYGRIPDIQRFNRTVADAARLLGDAEYHLALMGIPYVLGVHGAFVAETITMLRDDGRDDEGRTWLIPWRKDVNDIPLAELHEYFAERAGVTLPADLLELFHLSRRIRNRIIHFAGDAGSRLDAEFRHLPKATRETWVRVAGRPVGIDSHGRLELGAGELIAVLAFTRGLARSTNDALVAVLSREYWLRVIIDDYRKLSPQRFGERSRKVRRIAGHARTLYGSLAVQEEEIRNALGGEV
jgi:hypothetical protein